MLWKIKTTIAACESYEYKSITEIGNWLKIRT